MCDTLPPALLSVRPFVRPVSGSALAFALMRITIIVINTDCHTECRMNEGALPKMTAPPRLGSF